MVSLIFVQNRFPADNFSKMIKQLTKSAILLTFVVAYFADAKSLLEQKLGNKKNASFYIYRLLINYHIDMFDL